LTQDSFPKLHGGHAPTAPKKKERGKPDEPEKRAEDHRTKIDGVRKTTAQKAKRKAKTRRGKKKANVAWPKRLKGTRPAKKASRKAADRSGTQRPKINKSLRTLWGGGGVRKPRIQQVKPGGLEKEATHAISFIEESTREGTSSTGAKEERK